MNERFLKSPSAGGPLRTKRRLLQLSSTGFAILLFVAVLSTFNAWKAVDLRLFDYLSTVAPPSLADSSPVIVAIDEPSMDAINRQWPWPRRIHANLVERLRAAGAKAIGLDIIFSEPSADLDDDALEKSLGRDVVLAADETFIKTPQAEQLVRTEPLARFVGTGARVGIASIGLGLDGIFRQMPDYEDGFATRLATAAGLSPPPPEGRHLVQVLGPARTYRTVSYYQALDPDKMLPPGYFRDKIVLVGLSLQNTPSVKSGAPDAFATSSTVHTGKLLAGVEVQATILDNLVRRLSVREAGNIQAFLVIALAVTLAALASWRTADWGRAIAGGAIILSFGLFSFLLLHFGRFYVSPLAPTVGYVSVSTIVSALDYAAERRNRREIIRAFSRYLSPALVQHLANDPSQLKLGGERRTLTILFCDVRGFTTIAEVLKDDPEKLTALVNRVLTPLSEIVLRNNGTIDKYIGDCLMAFWNAPIEDEQHAYHAVKAGREMLVAVEKLNEELLTERSSSGVFSIRIGIGINTGECVVGNMGSQQRFDYSALGDSVNLASRLEGASKNYGVPLLIGEETANAVSERLEVVELDRIQVKGRQSYSPVFTVVRHMGEEERRYHHAFLDAKLRMEPPPMDVAGRNPELEPYYALVTAQLLDGVR